MSKGISRRSDRKTAIQRKRARGPSFVCDSVPQGRLSRSETADCASFAKRNGLCIFREAKGTAQPHEPSAARHASCQDTAAPREAVKFNDSDHPVAASDAVKCEKRTTATRRASHCSHSVSNVTINCTVQPRFENSAQERHDEVIAIATAKCEMLWFNSWLAAMDASTINVEVMTGFMLTFP
jgi:hypothetical protein